jgi:hypothetical protein
LLLQEWQIIKNEANMITFQQRVELDAFEMEESYSFYANVRRRFYQAKKVSTTIRSDNDIYCFS